MNSTFYLNRSFIIRSAATVGIIAAFAFLYQNCAPQKFSVNQASVSGITPAGTTCLPAVSVRPQVTFVPSSFAVNQAFTVTIANQALYTHIAIDFGDGSPIVNVNPGSSEAIKHTYTTSGNFVMTTSGSEAVCANSFSGSQSVGVGACIPNAATLNTFTKPQLPVSPAPVAPFNLSASISNGTDFTSGQTSWVLSGTTSARYTGEDVNLALTAGGFALQAQAVDSCGTTRMGPVENICVAAAGAPVVTVVPASFTTGVLNTFTILNPQNYGALIIDFGDGIHEAIPASGIVTHIYGNPDSESYTVSGTDTCGGARSLITPFTVALPICSATQPDGCSGSQYCTGRTTCSPKGTCAISCGQCGYDGDPVVQNTTCSGNKTCIAGGHSCLPTSTCNTVCGQCGFTGDPVSPVTTCADHKVCVTGGTSCAPTSTCTTVPGQCGVINPIQPTTTTTLYVSPPPITTTTLYVSPPPITTTTLYVSPPPITTTTLYVSPPPITTTTLYVSPPPITTTTLYVSPPPITTTTLYVSPPPITTTTLYVSPPPISPSGAGCIADGKPWQTWMANQPDSTCLCCASNHCNGPRVADYLPSQPFQGSATGPAYCLCSLGGMCNTSSDCCAGQTCLNQVLRGGALVGTCGP